MPADVREQLGWILADTVAAIVAGSAEPEVRTLLGRLATGDEARVQWGYGAPEIRCLRKPR